MAARDQTATILIAGVAGFNRGDDAIAKALLARLRREFRHASFIVTVLRPGVFSEPDVREVVIRRRDPRSHAQLARAVRESSLVLLGGGSIIQDEFGASWLHGIMALFVEVVGLARLYGRPIASAPIGVDTLHSEQGRRMARFILGGCELLAVRDRGSRANALRLLGEHMQVVLGADPAFELPRRSTPGGAPCLVLAPAFESNTPPELASLFARLILAFLARQPDSRCQILAMDERPEEDGGRSRAILEQLPSAVHARVELLVPRDLETVMRALEGATALVCMRLHAMILAATATPTFCISRGVKTDALAAELGVPFVSLRTVALSSVEAQVLEFLARLERGEAPASLRDVQGALAAQRARFDDYVSALRGLCRRKLQSLEVVHELS